MRVEKPRNRTVMEYLFGLGTGALLTLVGWWVSASWPDPKAAGSTSTIPTAIRWTCPNLHQPPNVRWLTLDLPGESAEGGSLMGRFCDGVLREIEATFYGEIGRAQISYRLCGQKLGEVIIQRHRYNLPLGSEDGPQTTGSPEVVVTERQEMLFENGRLRRWIRAGAKPHDVDDEHALQIARETCENFDRYRQRLIDFPPQNPPPPPTVEQLEQRAVERGIDAVRMTELRSCRTAPQAALYTVVIAAVGGENTPEWARLGMSLLEEDDLSELDVDATLRLYAQFAQEDLDRMKYAGRCDLNGDGQDEVLIPVGHYCRTGGQEVSADGAANMHWMLLGRFDGRWKPIDAGYGSPPKPEPLRHHGWQGLVTGMHLSCAEGGISLMVWDPEKSRYTTAWSTAYHDACERSVSSVCQRLPDGLVQALLSLYELPATDDAKCGCGWAMRLTVPEGVDPVYHVGIKSVQTGNLEQPIGTADNPRPNDFLFQARPDGSLECIWAAYNEGPLRFPGWKDDSHQSLLMGTGPLGGGAMDETQWHEVRLQQ